MFNGIFVTGTDTNVGKTVVSAALMHRYRTEAPLRYWKPVQTGARGEGRGASGDDDTAEVQRLSLASDAEILAPGVRLPHPVSPHLAARLAGARITVRALAEALNAEITHPPARLAPPLAGGPSPLLAPGPSPLATRWIIEGAGGLLVPINEREMMVDLIHTFDMPVVIAARSTLGTINHTLLTIEALRRRMLRVAGIVMVGPPNTENRVAIEKYGAVEVVGEMPWFDPLTPAAVQRWADTELDRGGVLFVNALR